MATRPLVSVITPTWQRAEQLHGAILNVREQDYRPIEHVIVSDGADSTTSRIAVAALDCAEERAPDAVAVRFVSLGRNWSSFLTDSFCAAPVTVGMLLASGDYQVWLADDERMKYDHISSLVAALEASGADFAYSRVALDFPSGESRVIGCDPPRLGEITNVLYRTDLLDHGLYPFKAGMTSDWACISRWQSRGARHAFVDRVTLRHHVDH
jgi:glycosyltransferase involved in cell wall biosynthesis